MHNQHVQYEDIWVPKNSGLGVIIGGFAMAFGFAVVWHIGWLMIVGLVGVIIALIIRLTSDDTEQKITARQLAHHEGVKTA